MKKSFGVLPTGEQTYLYTISCGGITATVTDLGATLVSVFAPDADGNVVDVVLGYDNAADYLAGSSFFGAIVGRSANRIKGSTFPLGGREYSLTPNEHSNNLHSGPSFYHTRLWTVTACTDTSISLRLDSPAGDQGYPGNASIDVTYSLDETGGLHIAYNAVCDRDTIFNLTNHSYFNLAGEANTQAAIDQLLMLPARTFCVADAESIPTGEMRSVGGTAMDFRMPKAIGQDIEADEEPLHLQGGYDHNFEVFCNPCAVLSDPISGRTMAVYTDLPGIQFYAGNFIRESGKGGVYYGKRSGVALETQFYPDAIHHPEWKQPVTKAGEKYHSETVYRFSY